MPIWRHAAKRNNMDARHLYYPLFALFYPFSLLPLRVHYFLSDIIIYPLVYHVLRYRVGLVRRQILDSFPEMSETERLGIERRFYHFFSDYIVETLKFMSMSRKEILHRVEWVGADWMQDDLDAHGHQIGFILMGHVGNWEWLSSLGIYMKNEFHFEQIYHPLRNKAMDELFLRMRKREGGNCISMKDTFRYLLSHHRKGEKMIVGAISDQSPKWEAMHQWCEFLHHKTSFFIGSETISKKLGQTSLYYLDITRPRRGYYRAELRLITNSPEQFPDYEITDRFAAMLEESIRRTPELWLWTHNRWKRTWEEWILRQSAK